MNKFRKQDLAPAILVGAFLFGLIIMANVVLNLIEYIFS